MLVLRDGQRSERFDIMRLWPLRGLISDLQKDPCFLQMPGQVDTRRRAKLWLLLPAGWNAEVINQPDTKRVEPYRKCVSHLLLPVHRCNQSQVAHDAGRGHTKHCGVLLQGNLHHRVFRLAREAFFFFFWCFKERGEMCYHGDVFFMGFFCSRSCRVEKTYQTFSTAKELTW